MPALARLSRILWLGAALLGAAGATAAPAVSPVDVVEPDGLYEGPQHGYVPATLRGATVIDGPALDRLLGEHPVLIDVALADRKPDNLPPGTIWLPAHRSIPGAVWLPDAGAVPLSATADAAFHDRVAALTVGDRGRPIVVFCHPECWGSWNAGKRLVAAGYTRVHWFPLGIEGWQDAHETAVIRQDATWARATARQPATETER